MEPTLEVDPEVVCLAGYRTVPLILGREKGKTMRKQLLCLMLVSAAGCGQAPVSGPNASAPASVDANAVALARFVCPTMT